MTSFSEGYFGIFVAFTTSKEAMFLLTVEELKLQPDRQLGAVELTLESFSLARYFH